MVNTRSRSHNSFIDMLEGGEDPSKLIGSFLSQLNENIDHILREKQIDIDLFGDELQTGIINLQDQVRGPYKATDIFATWNASALPSPAGISVDTTFAATASGTASLPVNAPITGFTVSVGPGAAAALTTVTVTNVQGGTLTYEIESPAAGGETTLNVNFPNPLPAVAGTQIGVTFTGTANTGAGSIEVTGQSVVAASSVVIQIGTRKFNLTPSSGQFALTSMAGMQILQKDVVQFTVIPAVACHFEIIGYADYRKIDTP